VAAIQKLVPDEHWRYVATQENAAKFATKGISISDYKDKSL